MCEIVKIIGTLDHVLVTGIYRMQGHRAYSYCKSGNVRMEFNFTNFVFFFLQS